MQSGVFSFCKAIDTFCPLGPWIVTPGRDPRPARPRDAAPRQRRGAAGVALGPDVGDDPRDPLATSPASRTRPATCSRPARSSGVAGFKSPEERARLYLKPGDVIEAEIERIGVLRNPVISWQEGHGTPPPPRIRPWGADAGSRPDDRLHEGRMIRALKAGRSQQAKAEASAEVRATVEAILADVGERGDAAVRHHSASLDGWSPDSFVLSRSEIEACVASVPEPMLDDIRFAQVADPGLRDRAARGAHGRRGRDAARCLPRPPEHPGRERRLLRPGGPLSDGRVGAHERRHGEGGRG